MILSMIATPAMVLSILLLRLYCHEFCSSQPSAVDFLCSCPTRTTLRDHPDMYQCWQCSSLLWCDITLLSLFGLDLVFFAKLTESAEFLGNKREEIGNRRSGRKKNLRIVNPVPNTRETYLVFVDQWWRRHRILLGGCSWELLNLDPNIEFGFAN